MANFKKTNVKIFTKANPDINPDNGFWKNYSACVLKEFGSIDYVDFSPVEPHNFAVTCSCRIQVYDPTTKLVVKTLSKFKEAAHGGSFRNDGRLICAGGDEAAVKLFDVNTKSLLRIFNGHKASVRRTFFTTDGMHIVSFSDDKSSAVWDIPKEQKVISFEEHEDYVRAGAVSPVSPEIYLSGGYDKIVNMYDTRTNKKVFSVNHDAPVESILFLPSGGLFLSAGGTEIRVWDCLANGRLLAKISQHHKTITCLQVACNGKRILSGSLDGNIKIYDSGTFKVVHTLDYPNSILSMGISADDKTIVAGMVNGMISIRKREENLGDNKIVDRRQMPYRHAGENLSRVDEYVKEITKEVTGKHDAFLRKFEYSKALDCVMMNYVVNKSPHVTVSVLQELIRRGGLVQALAGRDGKPLVNILKFIIRYIGDVTYGKILLHIANVLMDIYEDTLEELNHEVQTMFLLLVKKLKEEQSLMLSLLEIQGTFGMMIASKRTTVIPAKKYVNNLTPSASAQRTSVYNV